MYLFKLLIISLNLLQYNIEITRVLIFSKI